VKLEQSIGFGGLSIGASGLGLGVVGGRIVALVWLNLLCPFRLVRPADVA